MLKLILFFFDLYVDKMNLIYRFHKGFWSPFPLHSPNFDGPTKFHLQIFVFLIFFLLHLVFMLSHQMIDAELFFCLTFDVAWSWGTTTFWIHPRDNTLNVWCYSFIYYCIVVHLRCNGVMKWRFLMECKLMCWWFGCCKIVHVCLICRINSNIIHILINL
jgi:hypothetical protein